MKSLDGREVHLCWYISKKQNKWLIAVPIKVWYTHVHKQNEWLIHSVAVTPLTNEGDGFYTASNPKTFSHIPAIGL